MYHPYPHATPSRAAQADNPQKIAQHAIELIEQRLLQTHNIAVKLGVELECTAIFRNEIPHQECNDPFQMGQKKGPHKPLPFSRFVNYGYREVKEHNRESGLHEHARQYEFVTNHLHPMPVRNIPRAIESLRQEVAGYTPIAKTGNFDLLYKVTNQRLLQRQLLDRTGCEIRFDESSHAPMYNGMHLNVSLRRQGTPILTYNSLLVSLLEYATQTLFEDEHDLLIATDSQHARWNHYLSKHASILRHYVGPQDEHKDAQACYMENKSPCADCNPYYAVLLQMAAVWSAMERANRHAVPDRLVPLLNQLEPDLGERFAHAVAAHPETKAFQHKENGLAR